MGRSQTAKVKWQKGLAPQKSGVLHCIIHLRTSVKMLKLAKKKAAAQKRDSLPYPYKRIKRLKRFSSSGSPWDTKTDKSNSNEDCLPTNVPLFRYHRFN